MTRWDYFYQGLRVSAEFRLPDWEAFAAPAAAPDVTISLRPFSGEASSRAGEKDHLPAEKEYQFSVPGVGQFRVSAGREILVAPLPGLQTDELQPWLAGSAWAALCYQRGLLIMHASAVSVGDEAIAFSGPAGSGKSTLAAHMHARGHVLISDDLARVEVSDGGEALIYPSARRLKLRNDSLRHLEPHASERLDSRAGKTHIWTSAGTAVPLPLSRIYLLAWGESRCRRLTGSEAVSAFLKAANYRGEMIASMKRSGSWASQILELLRHVSLWELRRPRDFASIGETTNFLASHCCADEGAAGE